MGDLGFTSTLIKNEPCFLRSAMLVVTGQVHHNLLLYWNNLRITLVIYIKLWEYIYIFFKKQQCFLYKVLLQNIRCLRNRCCSWWSQFYHKNRYITFFFFCIDNFLEKERNVNCTSTYQDIIYNNNNNINLKKNTIPITCLTWKKKRNCNNVNKPYHGQRFNNNIW